MCGKKEKSWTLESERSTDTNLDLTTEQLVMISGNNLTYLLSIYKMGEHDLF